MNSCRALLLDIDGTLTDGLGGPALPGAVEAVRELARLRPLRYVTNATSWTGQALTRALSREGFPTAESAVITPAALARRLLPARGHDRGILIADRSSMPDLDWFQPVAPGQARAVLLASEAHDRLLADLQPAVEVLLAGAPLYTLQQNRVFKRRGTLVPDLGPVAAYLGYAARCSWENLGKPSPLLFQSLAEDLGCGLGEMAMVGDDAEFDAAGALLAGLGWGVLVRTGKYRPGDENGAEVPPSWTVDSLKDLLPLLGAAGNPSAP